MQIARTLAQKIALTLGIATPLLFGVAATTASVAGAPTVPPVAMSFSSHSNMSFS